MKIVQSVSLSVLFIAIAFQLQAQKKLDWAFGTGSPTTGQYVDKIVLDQHKNVYTIGQFYGNVDFDPGPGLFTLSSIPGPFTNQADIYIQKVDSNGQFLWARTFGGLSLERVNEATVDNSGNLILVGTFQDTVDFDPGVGVYNVQPPNNFADCFILKLDPQGLFKWVKHYGGVWSDVASGVISTANDDLIITGTYFDSVVFDPNTPALLTDSTNGGGFILRLDSNGAFQWVRNMAGNGSCYPMNLCAGLGNQIFITGTLTDTIDFDPGSNQFNMHSDYPNTALFISSYDLQGQFLWGRSLSSKNYILDNAISSDYLGNLYITGDVHDSIDFDPGPSVDWYALSQSTIYVLKLSSTGNYQWVKLLGGQGACGLYHDAGKDIETNAQGDIFICGEFCGFEDFDPGPGVHYLSAPSPYPEGFITQLDPNGNLIWAQQFGGNSYDICHSLALSDNSIYTCGTFNDTADVDPTQGTYHLIGHIDFYVMKLSECQVDNTTDVINACNSYTWTNGTTYYTSNNFAKDTFVNANGCDSFVSLQLTIHHIDSTISQQNDTLKANANGVNYQWLDCNNNYAPILGATQQTFVPSVNGSYAVVVSNSNCIDTSVCISFINLYSSAVNKLNIRIYPSPASNTIYIKSDRMLTNFKLYDAVGKLVLDKKLRKQYPAIPIDYLPNGVYLFTVKGKAFEESGKIIIQRD